MGVGLLLVHGIAQQDYEERELLGIWTDHLLDHGLDPAVLAASEPQMAYYGSQLDVLTRGSLSTGTAMGTDWADPEVAFASKAMDEIAFACAISEADIEAVATEAEILAGARAIGQSTWIGRRSVAIVSLLERVSPLRGRVAARVVRQAYTYLADRHARAEIDDLVRPRLQSRESVVVVSHSLGTVVAFSLLRELAANGAALRVPLFVTLGSPLAIREVQRWLGGSFELPANVDRWVNFLDPGDPVTLGRPLRASFAAGIVDMTVDNNTPNSHSIGGYLDDAALIEVLGKALDGGLRMPGPPGDRLESGTLPTDQQESSHSR